MLSVERAACARAADLNGNGYLDLVVGGHVPTPGMPHDSFVYIYWNGPEGSREDRRTLLPAAWVNAMAVADFNNDGKLDLFVCSYHDGKSRDVDSYIYWNREGNGVAASDRTCLPTHSASGCMAADFNGDGWTDLAVANHKVHGDHVGCSTVWWNGPTDSTRSACPSAYLGTTRDDDGRSRQHHRPRSGRVLRVQRLRAAKRRCHDGDLVGSRDAPHHLGQGAGEAGGHERPARQVALEPARKAMEAGFANIRQSPRGQGSVDGSSTAWLGAVNGGSTPRLAAVRIGYE